ncbi:hypothetical protein [Halococcus sp. PRR34]|uniref:hypothetical protein n=1 Tax=Halococcus sp. PRR34 TaxID=3020830 RepID=UPI00235F7865|nr:hypothetical protein [Halococcus sp. PRR34]
MSATTQSTASADLQQALQASETPFHDINELPPADKRELCRPQDDGRDDLRFWVFSNLVSLNFLDVGPTQWERVPEHAMDWHERVESNPLNIILSGRKHTKTTFVLAKIMYKSQYIEGHTSLYWANTEGQVEERMGEFEEMCEANPWCDNLLDNKGESVGALKRKPFPNRAQLYTTWVESSAEGGHVDFSAGDDPLKEIGGIPDERIEAWYSKVIVPMLNRGGVHVLVGTRKRPTDLYELLRTKTQDRAAFDDLPSYNLAEYPAIREPWIEKYGDRPGDLADESLYQEVEAPTLANALDVPGDTLSILWPEGRPADWLAGELGAQGKPYFLREYCMVFSQVEDAIIQRAHIDERCSIHDAPPEIVTPDSPYTRVAIGNDPASTKGSDSTSYVVLGVRPSGVRDILHVFNAQSIDPGRFKSKHQELDMLYSPSAIVIEDNGMQQYIVDDAVEFDRSLPIQGETTTERKHSWEDGIPRIAHRVAQGGYNFYREGSDHTEQLINALTSLTMDEGELQGHTPDPVVAMYLAEKAIDAKVPTGTINVGQQEDVPEEFESDDAEGNEIVDAAMGALEQMRRQR